MQTSKGRKRKLSCYKSKQRKKEERVKKIIFPQNIVQITYSSSSDEDVELDVEKMSSSSVESSDDNRDDIFSSDSNLDGLADDLEETIQDRQSNEESMSREKHLDNCIKEIKESDFLEKLFKKLQKVGLLNDFTTFMRNLESGKLPMDNIVFILMMDRVRFQNCTNTVGMRYGKKSKLFWTIVYRLCKESGLKFFSGSKNWGQVVNNECGKSQYSPDTAKVNFAVPDEKVLRAYKNELPKVIPPGKIHKCMEMLRNKKDIVLMADGKLVTKGLKTDFLGDVNLFGHERNPNLQNLKDDLSSKLDYISKACKSFDKSTNSDKYEVLLELTALCTEMNQRIRSYNCLQRNKLQSLMKRQNPIKNVDKAISACKTNLYTSAIWIKKALKCNMQLCKMMATLQHNLHLFKTTSNLDIVTLHNGRFLYDSNYVSSNVAFTEYPNLIKRYSDLWYELLRESVVSSETAFNALGLNGINPSKLHFKHFVKDEMFMESHTQVTYSQSELNGLASLCSAFAASLLPSCAVFYEEGCRFMDGIYRKNLLCSTHYGIIR